MDVFFRKKRRVVVVALPETILRASEDEEGQRGMPSRDSPPTTLNWIVFVSIPAGTQIIVSHFSAVRRVSSLFAPSCYC